MLCNWCYPDAFTPLPSRCYRCMAKTKQSATCTRCRRQTNLSHVWMGAEYEGVSEQLIKLFKFERAHGVGKILAKHLNETVPYLKDVIITFAPTATSRRRQRGYDQAQVVAKELAQLRKIPYLALLGRLGQQRQVGANRKERLKQLEKAFWAQNDHKIIGKHIVLIDDVMTTGATLEMAAKVLKAAGAKRVSAVVCAYQPRK